LALGVELSIASTNQRCSFVSAVTMDGSSWVARSSAGTDLKGLARKETMVCRYGYRTSARAQTSQRVVTRQKKKDEFGEDYTSTGLRHWIPYSFLGASMQLLLEFSDDTCRTCVEEYLFERIVAWRPCLQRILSFHFDYISSKL
jgi:hypothetical protein